jgi:hypothetical protein
MDAGNWIELAALLVTALGGGTVGISRLTRIAVAAETLAGKIEAVTRTVAAVSTVVQEHETRISRIEGGGRLQVAVRVKSDVLAVPVDQLNDRRGKLGIGNVGFPRLPHLVDSP